MTTTTAPTPTGRAIRTGSGYGLYHAETAYPNGDTDTACGHPGPMFGRQEYPGGWNAALAGMPPAAICPDCAHATPRPTDNSTRVIRRDLTPAEEHLLAAYRAGTASRADIETHLGAPSVVRIMHAHHTRP